MKILLILACLMLAVPALAVVEPKTETEYPDSAALECGGEPTALVATGVGLREKTFMKVDVYTIVSYVKTGVDLGDDAAAALLAADEPKRLQMDLRRGFSREKLINAFTEIIDKNFEDQSAFAADLAVFTGYFERDAMEDDVLVFDYCPGRGLTTTLNGEDKGTIANPEFMRALWTVWFGEKPANKGLREALVAALDD